ncbi:conserved exported hypothetical protein [Mesorhizobium metallidurans STM 2683]|uniref:3-oxoacyl-ACP synthase n=1 Tax=Mesorhizobium metallidurans STM 2683 TaxID=1297569 RepID=M5ENA8_9HYPH|nr:hypothetical protein [Mesorhizobium metallidurans]CCV06224.1 conserved exported hypothetical protein [Mesorhizobium metallidurans STM 2683]
MTNRLVISSIGMVTAVGLDAPSSCAAMRAGIDGFQETRFAAGGGKQLIGAPIPIKENWIGERRIAYMAAAAIKEALGGAPGASGSTITLILCLAEEGRPGRPAPDAQRLLGRIGELTGLTSAWQTHVIAHGRPSGHIAIEHARRLLSSGDAENVLIAAVDSYLTAGTITHYFMESRLLAPRHPDGFIPGEAAAAFMCTLAGRPGARGLELLGLGLTREPAHIYNEADLPLRGDGMTVAYRSALEETGVELSRVGYRIADLIGEKYWFKQSALATLRLARGRREFMDIWSPGETVGNVGAAVVPIMVGWAFTAAAKGYAAGDPVLIEASNDVGECGAAVLSGSAR